MPTRPAHILHIENEEKDRAWVSQQLKEQGQAFDIAWQDTLQNGMEHLSKKQTDLVLLNLDLPDSGGVETFRHIQKRNSRIPIVVLAKPGDMGSMLNVVRSGAQDYLFKGEVNGRGLVRAMRFALERNDHRMELRNAKLNDDMTGLYNRLGFLVIAERYLKSARRTNQNFFLSCIVIDNLNDIVSSFGPAEGNLAIGHTARILEESFRTSDLLARVGGNEFGVITMDANPANPQIFKNRLRKSQAYYISQFNGYKLSLSICTKRIDPNRVRTLKDFTEKVTQVFTNYKRAASKALASS